METTAVLRLLDKEAFQTEEQRNFQVILPIRRAGVGEDRGTPAEGILRVVWTEQHGGVQVQGLGNAGEATAGTLLGLELGLTSGTGVRRWSQVFR